MTILKNGAGNLPVTACDHLWGIWHPLVKVENFVCVSDVLVWNSAEGKIHKIKKDLNSLGF